MQTPIKTFTALFPKVIWPPDPGSPSPTWQSYIMSDLFLHRDCFFFFFLPYYHFPTHHELNTAKRILQAPWPWRSRHRDCQGLQPLCFTPCWARAAEWFLMGDMNQATKECTSWFGWVGTLENTLILFLAVLEKHWPAQCEPDTDWLFTSCALGNAQLSLRDNRLFFSEVLMLWLQKGNPQ